MNCPNCNRPLPIGADKCSECGTDVGESNAFLGLRSKTLVVIEKKISAPLFLVYAIISSALAILSLVEGIMLLSSDILSAALDIAVAAGAGVSAFAAWKLYFSHGKLSGKDINTLNGYNLAMMIVSTVETIFVGMIAFIIAIICLIGGLLLGVMGDAEAVIDAAIEMGNLTEQISTEELVAIFKNAGLVIAIAGVAVAAALIFVAVNFVLLYKNNGKYIKRLAEAYDNQKYDIRRYPKVRPWIFTVVFGLLGIGSLIISPVTGLNYICSAAMLAITTLWYASIHKGGCDGSYVPTTKEITTEVTYIAHTEEPVAVAEEPVVAEETEALEETPEAEEEISEVLETEEVEETVADSEESAEPEAVEETEETPETLETAETEETQEVDETSEEPAPTEENVAESSEEVAEEVTEETAEEVTEEITEEN